MPFYLVLVDQRAPGAPTDPVYVCEDELRLVREKKLEVEHPRLSNYLGAFLPHKPAYLPSAELQKLYPHDKL